MMPNLKSVQRLVGATPDGIWGPESERLLNEAVAKLDTGRAMLDPQLVADLKRDEGCRLTAYPDPLSGGDPWTIGYGSTKGVRRGDVWTQAQADAALVEDIERHNAELLGALPWVKDLDPVRQRVLFNMAFNLGVRGLLDFKNTLNFVRTGQYGQAADNMLSSLWAKQVGNRAKRLADAMRNG